MSAKERAERQIRKLRQGRTALAVIVALNVAAIAWNTVTPGAMHALIILNATTSVGCAAVMAWQTSLIRRWRAIGHAG